jgi:hypothetical protein
MDNMKRVAIVTFKFDRKENNMTTNDANKFYRKLYGYKNWSCYSRYKTFVKGFIHEINAVKISNSTVLVPYKNLNRLIAYLSDNNAKPSVNIDKIYIDPKEFEKIIKNQLLSND